MEFINLLDGSQIPKLGLGTHPMRGSEGIRDIKQALEVGYRLIDSAFNYDNEGTVGQAVRQSGIPREELVVTSKLPGRYHDYQLARQAIEESLLRLGLDYLDLYLIHWPNPIEDLYVEAWQALIDAQQAGLIRSIGVSNFLPEHLERLEVETGVLPVINQIELNPYFNQPQQRDYHQQKGIVTQSWSPLGRASAVLKEPLLQEIAHQYQKTVAQIILRWLLQLDIVSIPKSSNLQRQQENFAIFDFELLPEEITMINSMHSEQGRRPDRHPSTHQEF